MAPLQLLVAAAGLAILQSSSADVELPVEVPAPPISASAAPSTGTSQEAPLPTQIMRVLGVLETVGVVEIDRSSKLVSDKGVVDTASLPVRAPNWLPAGPEMPTMPVLYSRMMQLRF